MYDLRDNEKPTIRRRVFFTKKLKWKHLLYLLIGIIVLFPEQTGTFIGTWISDFFVTIIDIIKNG